ncbi:MAG: prepilin-type N-terminal cleavage/methylation domain-containing protein [Planctomycetota bacterium]
MFKRYTKPLKGFTLVELLVVIAIIAVLLSILVPSLNKARHIAKRVICGTRMKQIGLAFDMYSNDYDGYHPYRNDDPTVPGLIWSKDTLDKTKWDPGYAHYEPYRTWSMVLTKLYLGNDCKFFICPAAKNTTPWDGVSGWEQGKNNPPEGNGWGGNYAYNYQEYEAIMGGKNGGGKWKQVPAESLIVSGGVEGDNLNYTSGYGYYCYPYTQYDFSARKWVRVLGILPNYEIAYERHDGRIGVLFADGHVGFKTKNEIIITPIPSTNFSAITVK